MSNRAILIVLDGFGIGKDSPFNAIKNAKMPFYREILKKYPHSQLITHGEAVGLPQGIMGNSEVGHMTLGAGRIIYQDLTRITKSIADKDFFKNPVLVKTLEAGAHQTGRTHLMGLLSDGGVHSHIDHLLALLDLCSELKVPHVSVHAFLDGRDTPPDSAPKYLQKLFSHPTFSQNEKGSTRAELATLMGRYWAMDRDNRWDRVAKAYLTMTGQTEATSVNPLQVIQNSYAAGKGDEFVEPILFSKSAAMKDGDSVVFFNFRSDRAREISRAISEPEFGEFNRGKGFKPSAFAGLTTYDRNLGNVAVAYTPQNLDHIFGQWLEQHGLSQFRIAETEKYAHVTFFFNGGREKPFEKEDRVLIPSPKDVPTYDLRPEMSAYLVAEEAKNRILQKKYDFVLMNFANADMVGHTGNYEATLRAMEALDSCLAKVIGAAENSGYHVLLTADHGNAEEMRDHQGRNHTQHTLNPVPAIWIAPNSAIAPQSSRVALKDGNLGDIMPTLCELIGLKTPQEVTGKSLIPGKTAC
jgi:2,3-bisphosphoglycerate-independent phosphoglycerate mutase